MNFKMIWYILGWIMIFSALFMLLPMITALVYGETELFSFLAAAALSTAAGMFFVVRKPEKRTLHARDGFIIVSLSWIVLSLFGALPFKFSGVIPDFTDALFETVSGYTTTGATILSDVEVLPKCMLIWRSFTHWIGGMGVLVFIMAFVNLSGGQNMHIMRAESPGPSVSKLVPRIRTTAVILYTIYIAMTVIELILLLCGGMSFFDAFNTAIATAGTGGFGFRNDSMGSFSPYIQIVVTVFMLLFSVNFSSYYLLIKKRPRDAFNSEFRWFIVIIAVAVTIITINISGLYDNIGDALRHAAFTVATIMSTTGFAVTDHNQWPELSRCLIVILTFIGACAGSTGGGIKISRIIILIRGIGKELENLVHPRQVKKIMIDGNAIGHDVVRSVNVYMVCYVLIYVFSMLILSFDNHDFITNFTAVAATINNVGPGLELVGPAGNFEFFSPISKMVFIFDMLAGRLELFPVLVLLYPATWKK